MIILHRKYSANPLHLALGILRHHSIFSFPLAHIQRRQFFNLRFWQIGKIYPISKTMVMATDRTPASRSRWGKEIHALQQDITIQFREGNRGS